jgi:hypothetical protein
MHEQRIDAARERIHGALVPCLEQEHRVGNQILMVWNLALVTANQTADQVVSRPGNAFANQPVHAPEQLGNRSVTASQEVLPVLMRESQVHVGQLVFETITGVGGKVHQIGDHGYRQLERKLGR